jgi:hypothetical protein
LASSDARHLSNSVVNSHEVGVLRELGDDFSCAHPLITPRILMQGRKKTDSY